MLPQNKYDVYIIIKYFSKQIDALENGFIFTIQKIAVLYLS